MRLATTIASRRYRAIGARMPVWPFELNEDSPQRRGLLGLWAAIPGDFIDLTGRSERATIGGATMAAAPLGRAWDFDGSNDIIQIDDTDHLSGATQCSWSAWIDRDAGSSFGYLFLLGPISDIEVLIFLQETNNTLSFRHDWSGTDIEANCDVPATGLMHLAITYDGSSTANEPAFYVNGLLVSSSLGTGPPTGALQSTGTPQVDFGNRRSDNARAFEGRMYMQRFANVVWSPGEVWAQYDPQTRWDAIREINVPRPWPGVAAPPSAAIMNQIQGANLGSDLYNGAMQ